MANTKRARATKNKQTETLPLNPSAPAPHLPDNTDLKPLTNSEINVHTPTLEKPKKEQEKLPADQPLPIEDRVALLERNAITTGKWIMLEEEMRSLEKKKKFREIVPTIVIAAFTGCVIGYGICLLKGKKVF